MSRKSEAVAGESSGKAGGRDVSTLKSAGQPAVDDSATQPAGTHPRGDGIFLRGVVIGRGRKIQPKKGGGEGEVDELITYLISVDGKRTQVSTYNPERHLNVGEAIEEKVEVNTWVARGGGAMYGFRFGSKPNLGMEF